MGPGGEVLFHLCSIYLLLHPIKFVLLNSIHKIVIFLAVKTLSVLIVASEITKTRKYSTKTLPVYTYK